jgi:hypothetical protein
MTAETQQLQLFDHVDRTHLIRVDPLEFAEDSSIPEEWECDDCKEPIGFLLLEDGRTGFEWVPAWIEAADDPHSADTKKYCEGCLEYERFTTPHEPVTADMVLDIVDALEGLADRVVPAGNGRAEPFVARRLLIDAAAAARGAANQLDKFEQVKR